MKTKADKNRWSTSLSAVLALLIMTLSFTMNLQADELNIGTATVDITPTLPVAVMGQFNLRIANTIETPLTANVIAMESKRGNKTLDIAIMVSCDLVSIPHSLRDRIRAEVQKQKPEIDEKKIFINATHTHTAPVLVNDSESNFRYPIPKAGVLQVEEYQDFFIQHVSDAIIKAWENRSQGSVSWGLNHAAIAYNRRVVYSKEVSTPGRFTNGTAQMYGNTNTPEFINLESMEDHDLNILFFWDNAGKLIATTINVPCPSQEVEHRLAINADFWHPVREKLKQRFGSELCVLGWTGAAGDQSPRPMYRKAAEERMIKLRNLNRLEEIARRIVVGVEEAYETVNGDRHNDVKLIHKVETLPLPMRKVTEEEYLFSKSERDKYKAQIEANPEAANQVLTAMTWNGDVLKRYEIQQKNPDATLETEVHVIRIGDIAICTNPFELFTDYGIRMQARSNALQTFVIQLVGPGPYLPTKKAIEGGGYSAIIQSSSVGSEGGQILVDRTVQLINEMFPETRQ